MKIYRFKEDRPRRDGHQRNNPRASTSYRGAADAAGDTLRRHNSSVSNGSRRTMNADAFDRRLTLGQGHERIGVLQTGEEEKDGQEASFFSFF